MIQRMIQVGASVQALGVTSPVPMSGFAARTAPSTGEHDELGARALALDELVLITVDVCALEESTCQRIAAGVHPEAPAQVIVTATHTHAGPCSTPTRLARCTPEIEQQIISAAIIAGQTARSARHPCRVEHRCARGVGVASNRRHAGQAMDPPVQMLQFLASQAEGVTGDAADGGAREHSHVVASLLTYPCHPVVLDGTNRLLSGDYIHPLRERIEAEHAGSLAVFTTGCAGDLNTGHRAEASYSLTGSSTRTFAEAERVGTRIADSVLAAAPEPIDAGEVRFASVPVTLQLDRPTDAQLTADRAAWTQELTEAEPGRAALLKLWLDWAAAVPEDTEWSGRVSAFRLGEVTVVTLPGEPFLEVAEQITARVAACGAEFAGPCLVLGYADGCPGYFPSAGEYPFGGYEVEDAHRYYGMPGPFAQGSAELLVEAAVQAVEASVAGEGFPVLCG
ncbi:hypothetical protein ACT3SQ_16030 [Brachybacterium sp. AOP42-C2-15]|uniref:hypothetical protein n=1 Tax=unclassified Brachybacterium TaxID=2623841 RepID=UPI003F9D4C1E